MGWTGFFDWNRSDSNKEILEKELFSHNTEWEPLKWSSKGSHVWCLHKNKKTGFVAVTLILCKRYRDGEFCYKTIGLDAGPCEVDMPKNWLNLIDKSYFTEGYSKEWIEDFKKQSSSKTTKSFNIGDVLVCRSNHDIDWANGYKLNADTDFYVTVSVLNPWAKKHHKSYVVTVKNDDGSFRKISCRLAAKTFKNLKSVSKVQ